MKHTRMTSLTLFLGACFLLSLLRLYSGSCCLRLGDLPSPLMAGPRSAIGRAPDSYVRGPGFDTRSGNILSVLLPLFQEGQLSVTGESMCTKYWLTA